MSEMHLVFWLAGEMYALPVAHITSLVEYRPETLHQPFGGGSVVIGHVLHQGAVTPVVDLRRALGMPSMAEETAAFLDILEARKQDHIGWLTELEASVREDRPFALTTDPHACKFGKWYDDLMAHPEQMSRFTNGNSTLASMLRPFDEPHQRIHAIAVATEALRARRQHDEAMRLIAAARTNELRAMIGLFDNTASLVRSVRRSLLIVLELDDRLGILVDYVHGLREIGPEHLQDIPVQTNIVGHMALLNPNEHPMAVVDIEALYDSARAPSA